MQERLLLLLVPIFAITYWAVAQHVATLQQKQLSYLLEEARLDSTQGREAAGGVTGGHSPRG
jgi:hypothetical protein